MKTQKIKKTHSDASTECYAGEKPARVCMYTPSGQRWYNSHEDAVAIIRSDMPRAVKVRRWTENGLQYEDYKDANGDTVVQLEFAGPAVLVAGYVYE